MNYWDFARNLWNKVKLRSYHSPWGFEHTGCPQIVKLCLKKIKMSFKWNKSFFHTWIASHVHNNGWISTFQWKLKQGTTKKNSYLRNLSWICFQGHPGCSYLTQTHRNRAFSQWDGGKTIRYNGQFQVTVFSRFCYVLLCNHEYIHCQSHRQAKDYITRRNETENFNLKEGNEHVQCSLYSVITPK